jgi:hydroxymethylpyrimidine pyrophosphatase-like HAD family hydrolase
MEPSLPIMDQSQAHYQGIYQGSLHGVEIYFVTGRPPRWMQKLKMLLVLATPFAAMAQCCMTYSTIKLLKSG